MAGNTLKLKKQMVANAKFRAKRDGLPFNLTTDDFDLPTHCPILGYKLKKNKGQQGDNSPTLDRIIGHYGYVKDNVKVISHRANKLKSDASAYETWRLFEYIENHLKVSTIRS